MPMNRCFLNILNKNCRRQFTISPTLKAQFPLSILGNSVHTCTKPDTWLLSSTKCGQ